MIIISILVDIFMNRQLHIRINILLGTIVSIMITLMSCRIVNKVFTFDFVKVGFFDQNYANVIEYPVDTGRLDRQILFFDSIHPISTILSVLEIDADKHDDKH